MNDDAAPLSESRSNCNIEYSQELGPAYSKSHALGYEWWVVVLCMVAYIFSYIDRQILALLIGPIKSDMHLSDTQFSLLTGLAFSLLYSVMGMPIARFADRHSRSGIIAAGVAFWSIATTTFSVTRTFGQMFVARMCVGVGEAALSPAAYSLFADLFPKSKLGRAVGLYSVGSFLGGGLAFLVGGFVLEKVTIMNALHVPFFGTLRPWQMVFFIVGIPGMLVSLLILTTVKDPPRRGVRLSSTGDAERSGFGKTLAFIWLHRKTFVCHYAGFSFYAMALFAFLSWLPAFYIRAHGLDVTSVGYYLGAVVLVGNTTGVFAGGWLVDFLYRRGHKDAPMYAGAIGAFFVSIFACWFVLADNLWISLGVLVPAMFFVSFPMPTSTAAMQMIAPNQMRAQVSAIFLFVSNLFALGLGNTLVALITDYVFRNEKMVGFSIMIVVVVSGLMATLLLNAGRKPFIESIAAEDLLNSKRAVDP